MTETFLRRADVERVTGLSRSTLYAKMERGEFPHPVKIGGRAVGWLESEIQDWQQKIIAQRIVEHGRAA